MEVLSLAKQQNESNYSNLMAEEVVSAPVGGRIDRFNLWWAEKIRNPLAWQPTEDCVPRSFNFSPSSTG
jgi:hypothetical protein